MSFVVEFMRHRRLPTNIHVKQTGRWTLGRSLKQLGTSVNLMTRLLLLFAFSTGASLALNIQSGHAQSVGGVFGPNITEGDRSAEYRAALATLDGTDDAIFVHRIHYQHAFNGAWRARGVVQASDIRGGGQEFDFFQGELQWQFLEKNEFGFSSALRADIRISDGDRFADLVSFNSTSQWDIDENWRANAVVLLAREFGVRSRDGINLETRASVTRKVAKNVRLGLETFNVWGNSDGGFAPVSQQRHSAGPVATWTLGNGWSLLGGTLFGVSDGAADADVRFWINKSF